MLPGLAVGFGLSQVAKLGCFVSPSLRTGRLALHQQLKTEEMDEVGYWRVLLRVCP